MPYTPPSHRSPASSAPVSPDASRRPSFQTGTRPTLPRSASYLTKHRRTPSALGQGNAGGINNNQADAPTPPGTSTDLKALAAANGTGGSVRQSPPPITDTRRMPNGAVISPPESASSGSDDEDTEVIRGRTIENLKELKDAISQISQHRESSPSKNHVATTVAGDLHVLTSPNKALVEGMQHSFSTSLLPGLAHGVARRITHTRSSTEPQAILAKSEETSLTGSEEESDDEAQRKPQMVRKKSGELVRPALRPPSRRRPSSMPGTPTFSKSVHFDSHEHVRHFLQVDRPLAVSAGSSPVDNYDSDAEYPFPSGSEERPGARTPPYEWEIITTNFPASDSPIRKTAPVRLERVWLSNDQKCLMGSAAVANLAFQKFVICRFTLDYWKTTSEVAAEFLHEIRPKETPTGNDRFNFTIKLSDLANLESKTLYLCMRYNVNGQEYWDNNNGTNFQVDFRKKYLPQTSEGSLQGASAKPAVGALPRSTRRANPSTAPRPKSMPVGLDEFGDKTKFNFDQPIHEYLGEVPATLRLKVKAGPNSLPSDDLSSRLSTPSGQAFANRYDFGASLNAAVQAGRGSLARDRDGLYMKSNRKLSSSPVSQPQQKQERPNLKLSASDPTGMGTGKADTALEVVSPPKTTTLASSSYEELVNKYCFFGSKQSSPQLKEGPLRGGRFYDGADDGFLTRASDSTSSSLDGSPKTVHHAGAAMHHSLHPRHHSPYFANAMTASPITTSPKGSEAVERTAGSPSAPRLAGTGVGDFASFAGATANGFPYGQHLQDRFPFSSTEAPATTASCG